MKRTLLEEEKETDDSNREAQRIKPNDDSNFQNIVRDAENSLEKLRLVVKNQFGKGLIHSVFECTSLSDAEEKLNIFRKRSLEFAFYELNFIKYFKSLLNKEFEELAKELNSFLKKKLDELIKLKSYSAEDKLLGQISAKFGNAVLEIYLKVLLQMNAVGGKTFNNSIINYVFTCFGYGSLLKMCVDENEKAEVTEETIKLVTFPLKNVHPTKPRDFLVFLLSHLSTRLGEAYNVSKFMKRDENEENSTLFKLKKLKFVESLDQSIFFDCSRDDILLSFCQLLYLIEGKVFTSYYVDEYEDHLRAIRLYSELWKSILGEIELFGQSNRFRYLQKWNFDIGTYFCLFRNSSVYFFRPCQDIFQLFNETLALLNLHLEIHAKLNFDLKSGQTTYLVTFLNRITDSVFIRYKNNQFSNLSELELKEKIQSIRLSLFNQIIKPGLHKGNPKFSLAIDLTNFPIYGFIDLITSFENEETKIKTFAWINKMLVKFYNLDNHSFDKEVEKSEFLSPENLAPLTFHLYDPKWVKYEENLLQKLVTLVNEEKEIYTLNIDEVKNILTMQETFKVSELVSNLCKTLADGLIDFCIDTLNQMLERKIEISTKLEKRMEVWEKVIPFVCESAHLGFLFREFRWDSEIITKINSLQVRESLEKVFKADKEIDLFQFLLGIGPYFNGYIINNNIISMIKFDRRCYLDPNTNQINWNKPQTWKFFMKRLSSLLIEEINSEKYLNDIDSIMRTRSLLLTSTCLLWEPDMELQNFVSFEEKILQNLHFVSIIVQAIDKCDENELLLLDCTNLFTYGDHFFDDFITQIFERHGVKIDDEGKRLIYWYNNILEKEEYLTKENIEKSSKLMGFEKKTAKSKTPNQASFEVTEATDDKTCEMTCLMDIDFEVEEDICSRFKGAKRVIKNDSKKKTENKRKKKRRSPRIAGKKKILEIPTGESSDSYNHYYNGGNQNFEMEERGAQIWSLFIDKQKRLQDLDFKYTQDENLRSKTEFIERINSLYKTQPQFFPGEQMGNYLSNLNHDDFDPPINQINYYCQTIRNENEAVYDSDDSIQSSNQDSCEYFENSLVMKSESEKKDKDSKVDSEEETELHQFLECGDNLMNIEEEKENIPIEEEEEKEALSEKNEGSEKEEMDEEENDEENDEENEDEETIITEEEIKVKMQIRKLEERKRVELYLSSKELLEIMEPFSTNEEDDKEIEKIIDIMGFLDKKKKNCILRRLDNGILDLFPKAIQEEYQKARESFKGKQQKEKEKKKDPIQYKEILKQIFKSNDKNKKKKDGNLAKNLKKNALVDKVLSNLDTYLDVPLIPTKIIEKLLGAWLHDDKTDKFYEKVPKFKSRIIWFLSSSLFNPQNGSRVFYYLIMKLVEALENTVLNREAHLPKFRIVLGQFAYFFRKLFYSPIMRLTRFFDYQGKFSIKSLHQKYFFYDPLKNCPKGPISGEERSYYLIELFLLCLKESEDTEDSFGKFVKSYIKFLEPSFINPAIDPEWPHFKRPENPKALTEIIGNIVTEKNYPFEKLRWANEIGILLIMPKNKSEVIKTLVLKVNYDAEECIDLLAAVYNDIVKQLEENKAVTEIFKSIKFPAKVHEKIENAAKYFKELDDTVKKTINNLDESEQIFYCEGKKLMQLELMNLLQEREMRILSEFRHILTKELENKPDFLKILFYYVQILERLSENKEVTQLLVYQNMFSVGINMILTLIRLIGKDGNQAPAVSKIVEEAKPDKNDNKFIRYASFVKPLPRMLSRDEELEQPKRTPSFINLEKSPQNVTLKSLINYFYVKCEKVMEGFFRNDFSKEKVELFGSFCENSINYHPISTSLKVEFIRALWNQKIENEDIDQISVNWRVKRDQIWGNTLHHLLKYDALKFSNCDITIYFDEEEGVDGGGLKREWLSLISREIFNPNFGLFDHNANKSAVQPSISSITIPDCITHFRFLGRLVAKTIIDPQFEFMAPFSKPFLKLILNKNLTLNDLEDLDPEIYKTLKWIQETKEDISVYEFTFSYNVKILGQVRRIDLIENGNQVFVNDGNKLEYVKQYAYWKMAKEIELQTKAFLRGIYEIIPEECFKNLNEKDLGFLLSGRPTITIEDLKKQIKYDGFKETDDVIKWFWEILEESSQEFRSDFLFFVTGSYKVSLAIDDPDEHMEIRKVNTNRDSDLPISHTCGKQLDLPSYSSKELLLEKLSLALTEGMGGFHLS